MRTSANSGRRVPQTRRFTTMHNGREATAYVQSSGLKAVAVVCWQLLNSPATSADSSESAFLVASFEKNAAMTCSECSNPVSEGVSMCTFCGAPVEDVPRSITEAVQPESLPAVVMPGDIEPQHVKPRLWNPGVVAFLTLPVLGVWVASGLIALNWKALGRKGWAVWAWLFIPLSLLWAVFVSSNSSTMEVMLGSFILWLFLQALPQIWHVRQYRDTGYQKRRWILPIGLGLIFTFAWPKAMGGLNQCFREAEATNASASVVAPPETPIRAELTVEEVAAQKSVCVFPVEVSYKETSYLIFTEERAVAGSAVRIGASGKDIFFLTNRHVVDVPEGASAVKRVIRTSPPTPFKIVSVGHGDIDLVMFKVTVPEVFEEKWIHAEEIGKLSVGEECVAIGNTLGAGISVTTGIISRFDDMGSFTAIRTSAPIGPGSSGGALFRRKDGALIGITTAGSIEVGAQNVNIALPIDCIAKLKNIQ